MNIIYLIIILNLITDIYLFILSKWVMSIVKFCYQLYLFVMDGIIINSQGWVGLRIHNISLSLSRLIVYKFSMFWLIPMNIRIVLVLLFFYCRVLTHCLKEATFVFVKRSVNTAAHVITKVGCSLSSPNEWRHVPPP